MTRVAALSLLLASILLTWASPANATHFNRGHFVPAFQPCADAEANTATSNTVAACAPPLLISDCETDPANALRLRSPNKSEYMMRPKGRRRTRHNGGQPDIDTRMKIATIERCDGVRYEGTFDAEMRIRISREDPACAGEHCTLPDITYHHPFECRRGSCRLTESSSEALAAQGLPPFPIDHPYTIQILSVRALDLAGRPFLTTGLQIGDGSGIELARRWNISRWFGFFMHNLMASRRQAYAYGSRSIGIPLKLVARYVQAFEQCPEEATNTTTGDGLAACAAVPLSNCDTDPLNAVVAPVPRTGHHTDDGKGKIQLQLKSGGQEVRFSGWLRGIEDCSGAPYNGDLQVRTLVRATSNDPTCLGGTCTTINTPLFTTDVGLNDGEQGLRGLRLSLVDSGPFPGLAETISAEVLRVEILDPSGNVAVVGPSMLVRCNENSTFPNLPGGSAFCFGN